MTDDPPFAVSMPKLKRFSDIQYDCTGQYIITVHTLGLLNDFFALHEAQAYDAFSLL